jgi:hypothetical protein
MILIMLLISTFSVAQDHLYPEDSLYGNGISSLEYHLFVKKAFNPAFSRDVILKVIEIPSFNPESVLYLEKSEESYNVIYLEAETHYWVSTRAEYQPKPIKKCKVPLSESTALEIEKVWISELSKTQYPESSGEGLDGTTYHFSTSFKWLPNASLMPAMAGQTWSPNKGTKMRLLINLVSTLKGFCLNPSSEDRIQSLTNQLAYK